jgi:hypothetical protein
LPLAPFVQYAGRNHLSLVLQQQLIPMSYARKNLLGLILLVAASQAARADQPTTLVCDYEMGFQVTIDLNASQGTATINYPAEHFPGVNVPPLSETYAATFDPRKISFGGPMPLRPTAHRKIVVDRVSGALTEFASENAPYDRAAPNDRLIKKAACHVGKTQF